MSSTTQTTSNGTVKGERKRFLVLQGLYREGGKAKTGEIDSHAGIGNDLVRHHAEVLEEKCEPPLVKFVEKQRTDQTGQMDTNVYRLTEHGRSTFEAADEDQLSIEEASTFVELRSEVVDLRDRVDELEEWCHELSEKNDTLVKEAQENRKLIREKQS